MKDTIILQDLKKNWNLKSALPEPKEENKYFLFSVLYNKSSYYKSLIFSINENNDIIIDNFNGVYIQYNYNIVKNVNNKINFNKLIDRYLFNYDFSVIESSPLFSYFFTDEIKKMSFNILDSNENNIFMFLELSKALKKYDLKEYYQD
jgi:hypothetical protein